MLTASTAYKAAILPGTASMRRTAARVKLTVSKATVTYGTPTAINTEAGFSDVTKVIDDVSDNSVRIATCEPDYWRLDGSTVFSPAVTIDVGYASNALSLADGTFTSNPGVQVTTTAPFKSEGITLYFDRLSGDYPIEFDVDVLNGVTSVYHLAVTDNDQPYYRSDAAINAALAACDTLRITFKKMNVGYRRARLSELFLGIQQSYGIGGSDDMISIKTIEEIDVTGQTLPHGEAVLKLSNVNGDFNLITPAGVAEFLQTSGAEMEVEHGVYTAGGALQYVKTGTYLFKDWKDSGGKTVELNAPDTIGFYGGLPALARYCVYVNTNMPRSYLGEILSHAGIPSAKYDISVFPDVISSTGFMECPSQPTILDELRMCAQWLCKVCVVDQDGVIQFIDLDTISESDIDLDDCYNDPTIERQNTIGSVDVSIYSYAQTENTDYVVTVSEAVTGSKTIMVWVNDFILNNYGVAITGAVSYSDPVLEYGYLSCPVVGDGSVITIQVSRTDYLFSKTTYTLVNPLASGTGLAKITIDNPHIADATKAAEVAAFVLANYNRLLKFGYNWRGNPILEPGDMVTAETIHGDKDIIVTRQDTVYDGTLSATLEGVG